MSKMRHGTSVPGAWFLAKFYHAQRPLFKRPVLVCTHEIVFDRAAIPRSLDCAMIRAVIDDPEFQGVQLEAAGHQHITIQRLAELVAGPLDRINSN